MPVFPRQPELSRKNRSFFYLRGAGAGELEGEEAKRKNWEGLPGVTGIPRWGDWKAAGGDWKALGVVEGLPGGTGIVPPTAIAPHLNFSLGLFPFFPFRKMGGIPLGWFPSGGD